jgi:tetratricopeptide (TPR) repeat protein
LSINKRKILQSAQKYVQKGALDKALKDYQTLLEADPKDVNLRLKVGDLYLRLNKSDEAVNAYLKVADRFMKDGFDAKAVALYKQITKIDAKRVDVYLPLSELYQRLGLISDAMGALQTAADAHYREGNKPAALELMRKMATLDPSNTTSRLKVAELLRVEGMTDEAMAEFQAVAAELERQGEVEGRASVLQKVVELDPNSLSAVEGLGRCYVALRKWSQAEELGRRLIDAGAETNVEGYEILAEACQGLRHEDELPAIYRDMAQALRDRGQEDRAREIAQRFTSGVVSAEVSEAAVIQDSDFEAAIGGSGSFEEAPPPVEDPGFVSDSGLRLGDTHSGRERDVVDGRIRATARTPFNPPPLPPLGGAAPAAAESEEEDEEEVFLEESDAAVVPAAGAADVDADQVLAEASVYLRYGKHERAIESLRALLVQQPRNRRALEKLGEACASAEQNGNAVEAWRRAADVARGEGDAGAVEALRVRIAELDRSAAEALDASAPAAEDASDAEDGLEIEIDELAGEGGADDSDGAELSLEIDAGAGAAEEEEEEEEEEEGDFSFGEVEVALDQTPAPLVPAEPEPAADASEGTDAFEAGSAGSDHEELEFEIDVEGETSDAEVPAGDESAAAVASQSGGSSTTPQEVIEGLEEAEFFLGQGMLDEAEGICRRLLDVAPSHPKVLLRLGEVEAARAAAAAAPAEQDAASDDEGSTDEVEVDLGDAGDEAEDLSDLAAEALDIDIPDAAEAPAAAPPPAPVTPEPPPAPAAEAAPVAPPAEIPAPAPPVAAAPTPAPEAAPVALAAAPEAAPEETGDFDLAAELSDAFDERTPVAGLGAGAGTEEEGFLQVFAAFKAGVEKQLGTEDHEARFDLGIAYKEMGLLEDALGEFRVALQVPSHRLQCLHMMALCALDLGRAADAVANLEQALGLPDLPEDRQTALRFDLGRAYAAEGDRDRARSAWEAVAAADPEFCDVRGHLAGLDAEPDEDEGDDSEGEAFESFDDLMSEALAEGAEPETARAAPAERFESFEDLMGDDGDGSDAPEAPEEAGEDDTQVAQITAAEVGEAEEQDSPPPPEPAPEPPRPKRRKKISFV